MALTEEELYELRFPVGEFKAPDTIISAQINQWVDIIAAFPHQVNEATKHLGTMEKNWKYRPDGWKLKQVVHHCADSHMNSITRFKLTLTEDTPTIRPYMEHLFAELEDSLDDDLSYSIAILTSVHHKWVQLLSNFTSEDYARYYVHPEYGTNYRLDEAIGLYAWHCQHHFAHIQQALQSEGKYN